jgi:hypothetical protein
MTRKFFKTTYVIVVLSEDTPAQGLSLQDLDEAIDTGPCVGVCSDDGGVELTSDEMEQALNDAGSTPEFFGIGVDPEDGESQ